MENKIVSIAETMTAKQRFMAYHRTSEKFVTDVTNLSMEMKDSLRKLLSTFGKLIPNDTTAEEADLLIKNMTAVTSKLGEIIDCCGKTVMQQGFFECLPDWDNVMKTFDKVTERTDALLQEGKSVDIDVIWEEATKEITS